MHIEPQWIDHGHLNVAYYSVMFSRGIRQLWSTIGMGDDYATERNFSTFTAESHIRYLREINLGDPVQISVWLLDVDDKRLHTFEELRHATEGWVSATAENMSLHIDMASRKVAAFPSDILTRIASAASAHGVGPRPEGVGRTITMPQRK